MESRPDFLSGIFSMRDIKYKIQAINIHWCQLRNITVRKYIVCIFFDSIDERHGYPFQKF